MGCSFVNVRPPWPGEERRRGKRRFGGSGRRRRRRRRRGGCGGPRASSQLPKSRIEVRVKNLFYLYMISLSLYIYICMCVYIYIYIMLCMQYKFIPIWESGAHTQTPCCTTGSQRGLKRSGDRFSWSLLVAVDCVCPYTAGYSQDSERSSVQAPPTTTPPPPAPALRHHRRKHRAARQHPYGHFS